MNYSAKHLKDDGIELDKALVEAELAKQHKRMNNSIYKIYQKIPLSSCSVFDQKVFAKCLWYEFSAYRGYLTSQATSEIIFTQSMIKYAMLKAEDAKFSEVMSFYLSYLDARNRIDTIERAVEKSRTKSSTTYILKPNFTMTGGFSDTSILQLNDLSILPCIKRKPNTRITSINTSEELRKNLCKVLKIPDEQYIQYKLNNRALFLTQVTFADELEFIFDIMNGTIELDGDFGKLVNDYNSRIFKEEAEKNINSKSKNTFVIESLSTVVFKESLETRVDLARKEREISTALGGRTIYATKTSIYFETPTSTNYELEPYLGDTLDLGLYVLDYLSGQQFQKANLLLGLMGEFIAKKDAIDRGYIVTGSPVKLHKFDIPNGVLKDYKCEFCSISDVYYPDEVSNSCGGTVKQNLKPLVGVNSRYNFNLIPLDSVYRKYKVTSTANLVKYISEYAVCSFKDIQDAHQYNLLVSELTCALMYAECGLTLYEFVYKKYKTVSEDLFKMAVFDAERTYFCIW